jgi:hypothetical protein
MPSASECEHWELAPVAPTETGTPATVDGVLQVGLEIQHADDLTDALNWLDARDNNAVSLVNA